jgi:hypothetical protein
MDSLRNEDDQEYRDTIKRPAIDANTYIKAQKASIGSPKKANEILAESFEALHHESGDTVETLTRLQMFADNNDMTPSEAFDFIMKSVLKDGGEIHEKFRKQRLFRPEYWG